MTQGHISSSGPECTSYNEWRASLTGTEWSITLTTNGVTVACTDPTKAAAITTYIRDWTMPGHKGLDQVMSCDGITWAFGQCGPLDSVPSLMIRAGGGTGICDGSDCVAGSSEIMMRPCIDNANWGGGNGPTCGDRNNLIQPTQTFAISTGTSSQSSQCGGGSDSSGSSLVYVDWELSWTDAREYCRTHYGDLASIHSSSENAAVDAVCPGKCWIGGSLEGDAYVQSTDYPQNVVPSSFCPAGYAYEEHACGNNAENAVKLGATPQYGPFNQDELLVNGGHCSYECNCWNVWIKCVAAGEVTDGSAWWSDGMGLAISCP